MEELREAQPVVERVLHQAAEGSGPPGQGPLLDGGPGVGADVRGELVQAASPGVPAEVPAESGVHADRRRSPNVAVPPASPPSPPSALGPPTAAFATAAVAVTTGSGASGSSSADAVAPSAAAASSAVRTTAVVLLARSIRVQGRGRSHDHGAGVPATATGLRQRRRCGVLPQRSAGPLREQLLAKSAVGRLRGRGLPGKLRLWRPVQPVSRQR